MPASYRRHIRLVVIVLEGVFDRLLARNARRLGLIAISLVRRRAEPGGMPDVQA